MTDELRCKECNALLIETEWCGYPRHDKRVKRSCSLRDR